MQPRRFGWLLAIYFLAAGETRLIHELGRSGRSQVAAGWPQLRVRYNSASIVQICPDRRHLAV